MKALQIIPRLLLVDALLGVSVNVLADPKAKAFLAATMTVYKSPTCGCCGKWVSHIEKAGYVANVKHTNDLNVVKDQYRVPQQLRSCHTAVNQGYVFEGHIPVEIINKFLDEQPTDAIGLAVPGMPAGSPGMEMGNRRAAYDVLILRKDGSFDVYAHVDGNS